MAARLRVDRKIVERLMRERGFTSQRELAEAMGGVSMNTLNVILNGGGFRGDTLARMAEALDVHPALIMVYETDQPEEEDYSVIAKRNIEKIKRKTGINY